MVKIGLLTENLKANPHQRKNPYAADVDDVFPCHSLYSTSLLHHVKRAPVLRPGRPASHLR